MAKGKILFDAVYTGYLGNACQIDYALELKKLYHSRAPLITDPQWRTTASCMRL
ncbi:MAG: hypothetical protein ACLTSK_00265 [Christensenellales bacterium]